MLLTVGSAYQLLSAQGLPFAAVSVACAADTGTDCTLAGTTSNVKYESAAGALFDRATLAGTTNSTYGLVFELTSSDLNVQLTSDRVSITVVDCPEDEDFDPKSKVCFCKENAKRNAATGHCVCSDSFHVVRDASGVRCVPCGSHVSCKARHQPHHHLPRFTQPALRVRRRPCLPLAPCSVPSLIVAAP